MLFNSFIFVFAFLPLSLALTYGVGRWNRTGAKVVLLVLSLGFYAWWSLAQVPLLLGSIGFNFVVGELLQRARTANWLARAQLLLAVGVTADLCFLGWFKYANFFVDNINWATGARIHLAHIALPLAISFFTFQKIAYLVDTARGQTQRVGLLDFSLFAAFYPQLIAGPIVHFREVMPQLRSRLFGTLIGRNLMVGLVTFSIGMFKKTVLADSLAVNVNHLYTLVGRHQELNLTSAWLAAIGYTLQLYFDFSGYSDMAIGLGRMLGVKLPLNFHSPLRAPSIIDYWRRWHMTLQRFHRVLHFPADVPSVEQTRRGLGIGRLERIPVRRGSARLDNLHLKRTVAWRRLDVRSVRPDPWRLPQHQRGLARVSGPSAAPAQARRTTGADVGGLDGGSLARGHPAGGRLVAGHVPVGDAERRATGLA